VTLRQPACARRLGWSLSKFNRKLDHLCLKLSKVGVDGLHGEDGLQATGRRRRLVDHALEVELVSVDDLALLDSRRRPELRPGSGSEARGAIIRRAGPASRTGEHPSPSLTSQPRPGPAGCRLGVEGRRAAGHVLGGVGAQQDAVASERRRPIDSE